MSESLRLQVRRLDPGLPLPTYARPGDAGLDLHAREGVTLAPGHRALVPTGLAVALPEGCAGFVHPRSGLAARHGVTTLNGPGTVDAGYRGEIQVNLINHDPRESFTISRGDRIAQLVVQRVEHVQLVEVDVLPLSVRGDTGHGASGGFGAVVAQAAPEPSSGGPLTHSNARD
ncbi:dUTP diphosphatase [Luteipulveratus mongoliensis]|uniref:Deoxyuridine 5'-triphosphate nucleotidohydrolase n=1 Tax=Luteipulveratus mongoliensis TaxID=571913 RepID=A0A0K1JKG5_9MICO|nr:dUTP diphosphatase [Luteipulveratus mongoliensis]AKU17080.1 deoxyuridine 5'-triphosphate nucleotidohydrolase [Luteipulveratus mongoliensis]